MPMSLKNYLTINRLMYYFRRIINPKVTIYENESKTSGIIKVVDIGRERQLLINGRTHTFIMKRGKWNEVKRECWGHLSRSPFPLIKNLRVLVCGLGGGAVVHLLEKSFHPDSFTIIEHDPEIVKISKKYFSLDKIHNYSIIVDDATQALIELNTSQNKFDLIIDDVFYESARLDINSQRNIIESFTPLLAQGGAIFLTG